MKFEYWETGRRSTLFRLRLTGRSCRPVDGRATREQAQEQAGLDWEVVRNAADGGSESSLHHLIKRDPWARWPEAVIGRAPAEYTPVQNRELFGLLDPLIRNGAAGYLCAGELNGGSKVWVMAALRREAEVAGDKMYPYILLLNNHSGTGQQLEVRLTPVRIVCANMIEVASHLGSELKLDHDAAVEEKIRQASQILSSLDQQFSTTVAQCRRMAQVPVTRGMVWDYATEVFRAAAVPAGEWPMDVFELRRRAVSLFESGEGNSAPEVRGTLWAAYNGVTELVDHHVPDNSPEERLQRLWFGAGRTIKQRAFSVALSLADKSGAPRIERGGNGLVGRREPQRMIPALRVLQRNHLVPADEWRIEALATWERRFTHAGAREAATDSKSAA